ncbi:carbonic anhydrase [Clostridium sp. Mt-5]|uniref:Carbonic anhydrase n=1 Tax=Clostridium moutaii TaxID=3240932 RepID=A0ABV4BN37_9CLOT
MSKNFCTLLNCMDGRTQLPAINWIRSNFDVEYVDIISEPGIDKVISFQNEDFMNSLYKKMNISLNSHGSSMVFIAGHYDCAANKVDKFQHVDQIKRSVDIIRKLYKNIVVIGLWINENFQVEKVC